MTDKAAKPHPKISGIGAILTDTDGDIVAHAFDFDRSSYGGFKLWEAQRIRAKKAVIREYIDRYCYGVMAKGIDEYTRERIVEKLRTDKALKMTFIAFGYELSESELN